MDRNSVVNIIMKSNIIDMGGKNLVSNIKGGTYTEVEEWCLLECYAV
jgi:hypothetical protein